MTAEEKIKLCGIFKVSQTQNIFDYELFKNCVIEPYNLNVYADHLYAYGEFCNRQYNNCISNDAQQEYQKQDDQFDTWVTLCEQIKFVWENKDSFDIFFSEKDRSKKHSIRFNDQLKGNTKILDLLIEDLSEFEKSIDPLTYSRKENIDLAMINQKLKDAAIEKDKVFGVNKGRPTKADMLMNHFVIQELSFLLRTDKYFNESNSYKSVREVKLSNQDYRFIYDFLDFFKILIYEETTNTSKAEDIIEQRYKCPPLANNPGLKFYINEMILRIDNAKKHYK